jgi:hypothetical protein
MLEAEREYECTKCKHHFRVYSTIENGNTISLPKTCNSSGMPVDFIFTKIFLRIELIY